MYKLYDIIMPTYKAQILVNEGQLVVNASTVINWAKGRTLKGIKQWAENREGEVVYAEKRMDVYALDV